jgi:hypothetical protein
MGRLRGLRRCYGGCGYLMDRVYRRRGLRRCYGDRRVPDGTHGTPTRLAPLLRGLRGVWRIACIADAACAAATGVAGCLADCVHRRRGLRRCYGGCGVSGGLRVSPTRLAPLLQIMQSPVAAARAASGCTAVCQRLSRRFLSAFLWCDIRRRFLLTWRSVSVFLLPSYGFSPPLNSIRIGVPTSLSTRR